LSKTATERTPKRRPIDSFANTFTGGNVVRWLNAACVLLLFAAPLSAAPPKVSGPFKAAPGDVIEVEIEQDKAGKIGFHNPYDPSQVYVREAVPRREGTLCLIIQPKVQYDSNGQVDLAKSQQMYRLTVWTVNESTGATLVIDATGGAPVPPPKPKPDPVPPPADPLLTTLQAAYGADTSATKAADKDALAAVYRATASALGDLKTAGDLFAVIKGATEQRIAGRLKPLRSVFGGELEKVLPSDPSAVLTAQQKADAAKQLNRFSEVLGGVK
jgi:hypothetical protein